MYNPKVLKFQNLFSHEDTTIQFENNCCTILYGEVVGESGVSNNGCGKSTVIEAIALALTGDPLRNIEKNFIRNDCKECFVEMELENEELKHNLKIKRKFSLSKTQAIQVFDNEVLNTQLPSVLIANAYILQCLGMTRNDLLRYFIISQDNTYTFFNTGDTEKKEIINRINNVVILKPVIEKINEKKSLLEVSLSEKGNEVSRKEAIIESYERDIQKLREETTSKQEEEILTKLNNRKERIKDTKLSIFHLKEDLEKNNAFLHTIPVKDMKELEDLVVEINRDINKVRDEMMENKSLMRKLEQTLKDLIECPECGAKFSLDGLDIPVDEIPSYIEDIQDKLHELKTNEEELVLRKDNSLILIDEQRKFDNEFKRTKQKSDDLFRSIESNEALLDNTYREIESLENALKTIQEGSVVQQQLNSLTKNKDSAEGELKSLTEEYEKIEKEHQLYLLSEYHLGNKGFSTWLANKSIKYIENRTNEILSELGIELSVKINGYKVLKSGDIREKIEIFVIKDDAEKPFMSFSGGERTRVILTGIILLQELINNTSNGRGLNLMCLDESLGSIDTEGTFSLLKILKKLSTTIILVTQNIEDQDNMNEHYIKVVKQNGVSRVV